MSFLIYAAAIMSLISNVVLPNSQAPPGFGLRSKTMGILTHSKNVSIWDVSDFPSTLLKNKKELTYKHSWKEEDQTSWLLQIPIFHWKDGTRLSWEITAVGHHFVRSTHLAQGRYPVMAEGSLLVQSFQRTKLFNLGLILNLTPFYYELKFKAEMPIVVCSFLLIIIIIIIQTFDYSLSLFNRIESH